MSQSVVEDEVEVDDQVQDEPQLGATSLLAPTLPAAMSAEQAGGVLEQAAAVGPSRDEAPDNKKPLLLVKLGHRLCGFRR